MVYMLTLCNIYHQYTPNVTIYGIHGSYGYWGYLSYDTLTLPLKHWYHLFRVNIRRETKDAKGLCSSIRLLTRTTQVLDSDLLEESQTKITYSPHTGVGKCPNFSHHPESPKYFLDMQFHNI